MPSTTLLPSIAFRVESRALGAGQAMERTSPKERGLTAPKETSLVNRHSSLVRGRLKQSLPLRRGNRLGPFLTPVINHQPSAGRDGR